MSWNPSAMMYAWIVAVGLAPAVGTEITCHTRPTSVESAAGEFRCASTGMRVFNPTGPMLPRHEWPVSLAQRAMNRALNDRQAAELALFVYRSVATGGPPTTDDILVLPAAMRLNAPQVIDELIRMPKPLECSSEVKDAVWVLDCTRSGRRSQADEALFAQRLSEGILGAIRDASDGGEMAGVSVSDLQDRRMLVRTGAFQTWMRDYVLPPDLSVNGRPASGEEQGEGVVYVIELGRTQEISPDDFKKFLRDSK